MTSLVPNQTFFPTFYSNDIIMDTGNFALGGGGGGGGKRYFVIQHLNTPFIMVKSVCIPAFACTNVSMKCYRSHSEHSLDLVLHSNKSSSKVGMQFSERSVFFGGIVKS